MLESNKQELLLPIQTKQRLHRGNVFGWLITHISDVQHFYTVLDFILLWRSKQAQMSNCPLRFARENKKLLADSMRLEQVGESIIDNEKARNEK